MFYVAKAKRQVQKSLTSIGGEKNVGLNYFSADVQSSAEIEEFSLRTPRSVAIYLFESDSNNTVLSVRKRSDSNNTVLSVRKRSDSNNNTRLSDQHHVAVATLALRFRAKNICRCRCVSTTLSHKKIKTSIYVHV